MYFALMDAYDSILGFMDRGGGVLWVIAILLLLTFSLVWSENAFGLGHPAVDRIIYFFSLAVAVILLVVGYLLFRHWRPLYH